MKIVSTIEARMNSSRLPGKVMKEILGKPVLELLIERLKLVPLIDEIVIATTTDKSDDAIEELGRKLKVGCFRGSEEDVLNRVLQAAKSVQADLIVEITADCPLIDPETTRECIEVFLKGSYDYVSNCYGKQTFPDGLVVQVFPTRILEEVSRITNDPLDYEHVSLYIYSHPEKYRLKNIEAKAELHWPELAITLDTAQDYRLIKRIFEHLYPQNPAFSALEVVVFLRQHPELIKINEDTKRMNNYIKGIPRRAAE